MLLFLIRSPYLMNKNGIGMSARAMNPSSEFPHPYPNCAYIYWLLSGMNAAANDLNTVLAAIALAACIVNTSNK